MASDTNDTSSNTPIELAEFLRLADKLDMPIEERRAILGLTRDAWAGVASGAFPLAADERLDLHRRLLYVVPLMRRTLANRARPPTGSGQDDGRRM